jgi:hypothetical protein
MEGCVITLAAAVITYTPVAGGPFGTYTAPTAALATMLMDKIGQLLLAPVSLLDLTPYIPTFAIFNLAPFNTVPGTNPTLNGIGFTGATSVTMAGISVAFVVTNDFLISPTTPTGPGDGSNDIIVTNPGGAVAILRNGFAFA